MLQQFEHSCGVIMRTTCKTDKRSTFIHLTPLGTKRLAIFLKAIDPVLKRYDADLTALKNHDSKGPAGNHLLAGPFYC